MTMKRIIPQDVELNGDSIKIINKTIEERLFEIKAIDDKKTTIETYLRKLHSTPMMDDNPTALIFSTHVFPISPFIYDQLRRVLIHAFEDEQRQLINQASELMK
ncbi:MAG: hypothetical protein ACRC1W_01245 [Shewanella sp.]